MKPSPFDEVAADSDQQFRRSASGRMMRQAVWSRVAARFAVGSHVLELSCGTGEDAVYLARRGVNVTATDASAQMLDQARRKVDEAKLTGRIQLRQLAIEELASWEQIE